MDMVCFNISVCSSIAWIPNQKHWLRQGCWTRWGQQKLYQQVRRTRPPTSFSVVLVLFISLCTPPLVCIHFLFLKNSSLAMLETHTHTHSPLPLTVTMPCDAARGFHLRFSGVNIKTPCGSLTMRSQPLTTVSIIVPKCIRFLSPLLYATFWDEDEMVYSSHCSTFATA